VSITSGVVWVREDLREAESKQVYPQISKFYGITWPNDFKRYCASAFSVITERNDEHSNFAINGVLCAQAWDRAQDAARTALAFCDSTGEEEARALEDKAYEEAETQTEWLIEHADEAIANKLRYMLDRLHEQPIASNRHRHECIGWTGRIRNYIINLATRPYQRQG
jgi:hypothetical protein